MSHRMEKVNKHLQRTFGEILQREADLPAEVLVTVARVETTPNLKSAEVFLYINPVDRSEEIIELLRPQLYDLQGSLNRALDLRPLPRIRLTVDYGAEHALHIEEQFKKLDQERASGSHD